ncbi:hypothetical protein AA313_de0206031 [Arthrobotrys entomopaga]|nr:hypothetical protein AA313_de0206031 [Arthrobotrys entomopaga]
MKISSVLLAAAAASTVSSAIISTAVPFSTAATVAPTVSPTGDTSPTRSVSTVPSTTVPSGPSEPSYPPATGTPGPIDVQVDAAISAFKNNVLQINAKYNATCAKGCTASHIQAWGDEHAAAVNAIIVRFQGFPVGYVYWWYPQL